MAISSNDSWNKARQAFADQFEKYGNGFVYRRSQKGEAIPVSAEEREQFIDEFNRNIRRGYWILVAATVLILGATIFFSVLRNVDLSEGVIVVSVLAAMIPSLAYNRWLWTAPARALAGRTPVARERSSEEVRRLRFQRITYGQLAGAAFAGAAMPFIAGGRHDIFSGWNRLWLIVGGGLALFAAVQAFRKWRVEQDDPYGDAIPGPPIAGISDPVEQTSSQNKDQVLRYVPLGVIVLAIGVVALTPAGQQLARQPSFWPILMVGFAGWALFTVTRGFSNGQIQPFVRGFSNTYEREAEPKRFWASMAWNAAMGCLFLWMVFQMSQQNGAQAAQDRCYNRHREFPPRVAADACTQLIDGKTRLTYLSKADAFVDRGISEESLNDRAGALNDYSNAIRVRPDDYYAYADRGLLFLDMMKFDPAIADFTKAHELDPKSPWPLANRGVAYAWKNDRTRAEDDFELVRRIDPANPVVRHGEAIMSMTAGNLEGAIGELTSALKLDPRDYWALQTRADAYQQAGDFTQARADRERLQRMMETRNTTDSKST